MCPIDWNFDLTVEQGINSELMLRNGNEKDALPLTELAMRSKAYWGYDSEFMAMCRDELSHKEADFFDSNCLYMVYELENEIAGFYKLVVESSEKMELEALFVEPAYIGKGIGRILFFDALCKAQSHGATTLITQSDPNAEAFYLNMGGVKVGSSGSGSIEGRQLPMIRFDIERLVNTAVTE